MSNRAQGCRGSAGISFQSAASAAALLVLVIVGVIVYNQVMASRKEEKFYKEIMSGYKKAKTLDEKARHLNYYIDTYPQGKYAGQVNARIAEAEKQRGLDLVLDCSIVFHDGKSVPLTGRIQLLKSNQAYAKIKASMEKNAKIAALTKEAGNNETAQLELFDAIGVFLQKLKVQVVDQAMVDKGKVKFSHLDPGQYLVYGVASAGQNITGIFDAVTVREGESQDLPLKFFSAYARDADRRAGRWLKHPAVQKGSE
jgi:hypothetical protein